MIAWMNARFGKSPLVTAIGLPEACYGQFWQVGKRPQDL